MALTKRECHKFGARPGISGAVQLRLCLILFIVVALTAACSGQNENPQSAASSATAEQEESVPQPASPYDALPPAVRDAMDKPFTGDLDELVNRRAIRVA